MIRRIWKNSVILEIFHIFAPMEVFSHGKLTRVKNRHAPEVSQQTGFASPATHYMEPSIDLNQELLHNKDATFYVRIDGDAFASFSIHHNDVLIIDRSLFPKSNELALVVQEGEFKIIRISATRQVAECRLWGVITYIIHAVR